MKVAIAGAGIAGLSIALRLSAKHDVRIFESGDVPGGKIHSQRVGEFVFDWGPNGFLSTAEALGAIVDEAGLRDAVVPAAAAASKRYVYWRGRLHAIPSKPQQALAMTLLSLGGKLRALAELLPGRRNADAGRDEDVYGFFARRFGREVAERIVAPALLGITGGDARDTSVAALFPRLPAMERERGSVLRGAMRRPRNAAPPRLTSFGAGGMQTLTDAIARKLGDRLTCGCAIERIEHDGSRWRMLHASGSESADAVVVATPADAAASLLAPLDADMAALLASIPYAPMRVAGVAFRNADVPIPLDGFGFLAARGQGIRVLGALYTSAMYPQQAPAGSAYLRVFLGGSVDPEAVTLDSEQVRATVLRDLRTVLHIDAAPIAFHEAVWAHAIPQYRLGHGALVSGIERRATTLPGLFLAGNAYRGLGLSDTVSDALAVAAAVEAHA